MKWTSIFSSNYQERTIEGENYLCYAKGGRQFTALYQDGVFMAYNPFNESLEEAEWVLYYMPLPTPPKQ